MRKKRYGIWQEYRWSEVYEKVRDFSLGLIELGLRPEQTVSIIGDNEPEIYWAQIATHSARARTICIFSDATAPEIAYVLMKSEAVFLIAHDQEQVDKALEIAPQFPQLQRVIYWEERGLWQYEEELLLTYEEVLAIGRRAAAEHPDRFEQTIQQTRPLDTIILSMTSGTTSLPKLAMITNWQLIYSNHLSTPYFPFHNDDNWLSFSPMALADGAGLRLYRSPPAWHARELPGGAGHSLHRYPRNRPGWPRLPQPQLGEPGEHDGASASTTAPSSIACSTPPSFPSLTASSTTRTPAKRCRSGCGPCAGWGNTPSSSPCATKSA